MRAMASIGLYLMSILSLYLHALGHALGIKLLRDISYCKLHSCDNCLHIQL